MTPSTAGRPLAIVGGTLIDGKGGPPLVSAGVVVEGARFASVGPASSTPIPPGADVIGARGKFLVPGLVDMHVHVYTQERWHPEFFLAAGVTTVLDLGGQVHDVSAYRAAVESKRMRGPRLYFTGPMLEEEEPYAGFAAFCRHIDAAKIETEVDGLADAGVDGIKLYITVRPETARRACARAHARGLPVFMHQHATWGSDAAAAGVNCVEHLNVFGELADPASRPPEPGRLTPFEYGGWLWRRLGDIDPRSDAAPPLRRADHRRHCARSDARALGLTAGRPRR